MNTSRLLGILLLVGGVICVFIAFGWSDSAGDQVKHFFTGDYRDETVWLGLIGVVAAILGVATIGFGFRRSASGSREAEPRRAETT